MMREPETLHPNANAGLLWRLPQPLLQAGAQ